MFGVVQIVGVVHDALNVAFVVAHFHFGAEYIFHNSLRLCYVVISPAIEVAMNLRIVEAER